MATKTRRLTEHAAAAKLIRRDLKAAYSSVTFKVRARSFAGGDDVDIEWQDGPTVQDVESLTAKYQEGDFNGMIDLYEATNRRHDIPQVMYVQAHRSYSREAINAMIECLNAARGFHLRPATGPLDLVDPESDEYTGNGYASHEIHRTFWHLSLVCRHCRGATMPGDAYCPECGRPLDIDSIAA